jgi:predicted permease
MTDPQVKRPGIWLWLIQLIGVIVPRRWRADWKQEWEAELRYRELQLAEWERLDLRHRIGLSWRSMSALWDALLLQPRRWEDEMFQDLRFGVRLLRKNPGLTFIAIVTLGLGIGANSSIFNLLDRILVKPLPVDHPEQLVAFVRDANGEPSIFSYPLFDDLRKRNEVLSGLLAYFQQPFSLTNGDQTERVVGQIVSGNYFDVLGVQPAIGSFFLTEEDRTPGSNPVAVISHGLWRRRFAADPAVIGKTVELNAYRYTIVGVSPAEFTGTTRGTVSDVYVPMMMQVQAQPGQNSKLDSPNSGWLRLIGRLKPKVSRQQAQVALSLLREEPRQAGKGSKGSEVTRILLMDGSHGFYDTVRDLSQPLKLLMGVVGFILLIACANLANLLLARGSSRRREMAVRLAIGAGRGRIVRQLLTESTILAATGGCAGWLVALWLTRFLLGFQQRTSYVPRAIDGSLDLRTLAFTLGLTLLTGFLFGLAPALQGSRSDLVVGMKDGVQAGSIGRFNLRRLLVVIQVALSVVVLIGAGLCLKSLGALREVDPGLEPAKVVTASFSLSQSGYDEARGREFVSQMTQRIGALAGVEGVAFVNIVAFSDLFWFGSATIEGYQAQPNERLAFDFNAISPDYFKTVGTPLVSGREFTPRDAAGSPNVIVINEAMARRYWPGQDPIGRRTSRGEVVGIVRDSREKGLRSDPRPAIYLPLLQNYQPDLTVLVRTALDSRQVIAAIRREVQSVEPSLPLHNLQTLAAQRDGSLYPERLAATLLTIFGCLALLLAAIGIYGVMSYAVAERTREMGIRSALGAQPGKLMRLVIGQGMAPAVVGLAIGSGASLMLTRLMKSLLFGVSATDPVVFAAIPLLLGMIALLACYVPARRAMRVDPVTALRHD